MGAVFAVFAVIGIIVSVSKCVSTKEGILLTDVDTEETPGEDGARDGREVITSPGTPGAQKTGRGRKDPSLEPLEGAQHWGTLTSDVWSPGLREDRLLLF